MRADLLAACYLAACYLSCLYARSGTYHHSALPLTDRTIDCLPRILGWLTCSFLLLAVPTAYPLPAFRAGFLCVQAGHMLCSQTQSAREIHMLRVAPCAAALPHLLRRLPCSNAALGVHIQLPLCLTTPFPAPCSSCKTAHCPLRGRRPGATRLEWEGLGQAVLLCTLYSTHQQLLEF